MFAEERQRAILEQLRRKSKVTVEELTAHFNVSPPTIRTDLTRLEEQGYLRRTHGGAIAVGNTLFEPPFAERAIWRQNEKRKIAQAAAALVNEGETLLLDAGTTCYEIALHLKEYKKLTVVTNSLATAQTLSENEGIQTLLIGGVVQPARRATMGVLAARFLEPIRCDKAFVAFSGVSVEGGFSVIDFDAATVKRQMMKQARQVFAVVDSSKIGQTSFANVAAVSDVTQLITDSSITPEDKTALEEVGLRILIAE